MPIDAVGGGPVVDVIMWPGSGSNPSGRTAYGLFDDDGDFEYAAPRVAKWICSTLGYPMVSIELQDQNIYNNLETATMQFTSIVNEFNMRDNMMAYQGMPTGSSFSQTLIRSTPMPFLVKLAADYGTEAQSGGTVDLKRGYISLTAGEQDYDLQDLWADVSESGTRMEIRRVFHERVPAMQRFFDPFAGTGTDMSSLLGSFGFTGYAVASNFLIMPTFETLLRAQAIELNDQIRRSNYSFEIHNNKIRVYPLPDSTGDRIWFEYYVESDKFRLSTSAAGSPGRAERSVASDFSNVPFCYVPFSHINDVGRQWIFNYTLALTKITLGNIRSKYDMLPIPNSEIRLDGETLRQEGQQDAERLIDQLRETLEESGKAKQMEKQKENELNMQEILRLAPMPIFIL
jgi:hypothetical protein